MSNAEKAKPEVYIDLGGKQRKVHLTFGALCALEKELGVNTLGNDFWKNLTARGIVTLLWASLRKHDPQLTIEEVGDMIDFSDLEPVMNKLKEAMDVVTPKANGAKGEKPTGK